MNYYYKTGVSLLMILFSFLKGNSQFVADTKQPSLRGKSSNNHTVHKVGIISNAAILQHKANTITNGNTSFLKPAPPIIAAEYFIDKDPGVGKGWSMNVSNSASINVSTKITLPKTISGGFHQLFIRFKDSLNNWGLAEQRSIYIDTTIRMATGIPKIVAAEYFYGVDSGVGKGIAVSVAKADSILQNTGIILPKIPIGTTTISIRFKDSLGRWGIAESRSLNITCKPFVGKDTIVGLCASKSINITGLYNYKNYASYSWSTPRPDSITQTGKYTLTVNSIYGCKDTVAVTVQPINPATRVINLNSCYSVVYNGTTYYNSQTIKDTIRAAGGCDSMYQVVNIAISHSYTPTIDSVNISGCDSVFYNGQYYKNSYRAVDTFYTRSGCDSLYHITNISVKNGTVSGNILYPNHKPVSNVAITINGLNNTTGVFSGNYYLNCLNPDSKNTLKAVKGNETNKTNGVTAVDIALTQSHILAKNIFNSPYKLIAADVNGDNKVTALDIVYMKRLILGIDTIFTNTTTKQTRLWAFVDSSYNFPDSTNPFPIKDSISYTGLLANKTNQTFIGCKLGDVNWDWNPAVARPVVDNRDVVELSYSFCSYPSDALAGRADGLPGRTDGWVRIPVRVKNFKEMLGMQFTISFDPTVMQWQGLGNNPLGIEIGTTHVGEGSVSFLWVDAKNTIKTLEDGSVLMELVFKSIDNGQLIIDNGNTNTLMLDGSVTAVVAYDKDYGVHNVVLKKTESIPSLRAETWAVAPNPIKDGVINVQMNLRDKKTIVFRLIDNTGRVLLIKQVEGVKGSNNIVLREGNIAGGTYYLQAVGVEGVKQLRVEN